MLLEILRYGLKGGKQVESICWGLVKGLMWSLEDKCRLEGVKEWGWGVGASEVIVFCHFFRVKTSHKCDLEFYRSQLLYIENQATVSAQCSKTEMNVLK